MNILDYIEMRGDVTFDYSGLNAVDALILSAVTYINYPNANEATTSFKKGYEEWLALPDDEKFRGLKMVRTKTEDLAAALAGAKRYADIGITRYVEVTSQENEEQFSAMTFLLPDGRAFVAYRGTDHTLVGWKEDFNMAVIDGTPSQLEATKYLVSVAEAYPDAKIIVGGHSKGGNLAIWAATHMPKELKARLERICAYDSPGLSKKVFESEDYESIKDRIISFVPETSVVGIIMYNAPQLVVKSDAETFMQHDPFSWQVKKSGFEYLQERSFISRQLEKQFDKTVENMDTEEYSKIVNRVYDDIKRLADIL